MKKPKFHGWHLIFPGNNFIWYASEEEALRQKMLTPCAEGPFWVTDPQIALEKFPQGIWH